MPDPHPLVCRFGAFGDMVMLTPMLKRLYQRCGKPVDVVGIGGWTATMFEHMPYVRRVYTIDSRKTPYLLSRSKKQLTTQLRKDAHQYAWLCEQSPHSYKLMKKGGVDVDASINALDYPRLTHEHASEHWFRLANINPGDCSWDQEDDHPINTELFVSGNEIKSCRDWLTKLGIAPDSPLVCVQPGNKKTMRAGRIDRNSNTKYWHEANWAAVIDVVTHTLPGCSVLLCGVPAEYSITQDIYDLCVDQRNIYCVANDLPLRRLLALLTLAHSCISVDTGPAHAAAALNCPVTVLFGQADARICRPISSDSPVEVVAGKIAGAELTSAPESWAKCHNIGLITPEDVILGWRKTLQPAAKID